jgi:tetratricopeptide (TPR) repeat protein
MKSSKERKWVLVIFTLMIVLPGILYFSSYRINITIDKSEDVSNAAADTVTNGAPLAPSAKEHFKKGLSFLNKGKLDEALKEFQKSEEISPKTAVVHYWVGMTFFYKKDFEKAIAQFRKVLDLDPKNYHAISMIGKVLSFDKKKLDEATRYLKMALAISPEYADAHSDLARIYAMRGNISQAVAEFAFIFRGEPRYAIYHYELGRLFESMKAPDRAKKEFERALVLNPKMKRAKEALKRMK